jgi:hypothetical protein
MLARAWAEMRGRRWLVLGLALVNLTITMVVAQPLSAALGFIDFRPAAAQLVAGDNGLLGELVADHPEVMRVAGGGALTAFLLGGLLAWLLAGGVLDGRRGLGPFLGACGEHAGAMLKLGLLGLVVRIFPAAVAVAGWFALRPWWRPRGFAELVASTAILFFATTIAWSWSTVALDGARGLLVRREVPRARTALRRGIAAALRRPGAALLIALFSVLAWLLATLAYAATSRFWPAVVPLLPLSLAFGMLRAGATATALIAGGLLTSKAPTQMAPAPPV